jgi:hypothetical protein
VPDEQQIVTGVAVVGSDGKRIGTVKSIPENGCFRVDVPQSPDYYVPLEAVRSLTEERVELRVNALEAGNMGWELKPPKA